MSIISNHKREGGGPPAIPFLQKGFMNIAQAKTKLYALARRMGLDTTFVGNLDNALFVVFTSCNFYKFEPQQRIKILTTALQTHAPDILSKYVVVFEAHTPNEVLHDLSTTVEI